jgi:hypothetical protein
MRGLLLTFVLALLACGGPSLTAQDVVRALPSDYEGVVVAILKEHVTTGGSYCLKIVGKPPADTLVSLLVGHGHKPVSCRDGSRKLDFVEIRVAEDDKYFATVDDTCGVLCGRQLVFDVGRDPTGQFLVLAKRVALEY